MIDLLKRLNDKHEHVENFSIEKYDVHHFDLIESLKNELRSIYGIKGDISLEKLHTLVSKKDIEEKKIESGHWLHSLSELSPSFHNKFYQFVKYLAEYVFKTDIYFEKEPLVRFHVPGKMSDTYRLKDGNCMMLHSDNMLGDYFEQINVWFPFCDVQGSSTLSLVDPKNSYDITKEFMFSLQNDYVKYRESRTKFFDFISEESSVYERLSKFSFPCNLKAGEYLFFDPRILHGTQENTTDSTRVSMDFRILPVESFNKIEKEFNSSDISINQYLGEELVPGGFYHKSSALNFSIE
ncbi:phytanoyl-CoA dioxygenase family protein [Vibrio splendidus]|uniref:phytanoyl-CoA dioxygenase family protein n=1 Tax=Vibrio splendidus TaxID=29497 RepID=UPI0012FFE058|nr:phytanoyl-CoA dioxygenase family protein [Vibrio splendidus]